MFDRSDHKRLDWAALAHFLLIAALASLLAGIGGAALARLLHATEFLLFGVRQSDHLEGPLHVGPMHRFMVVAIAGVVMATLWWAVRRWGAATPTPEQAAAGQPMSPVWTTAESTIQVLDVAAGASIGREAAPREIGAMLADRLSAWSKLTPEKRALLIACAAGGGLAATYNVPIAGAILGVESILGLAYLRGRPVIHVGIVLATALGVSYGATLAGRLVVPNRSVYRLTETGSPFSLSLLLLAVAMGLVVGPIAEWVGGLFTAATGRSPRGNRLLLAMPVGYLLLALLAAWQPLVMGNGHVLAQQVFNQRLGMSSLLLLIVLKPLATILTMGVGARGGRITPAFSTGSAAGAAAAVLWAHAFSISPDAAALTGAAVFLSSATGSPLTALSLALEMTGAPIGMVLPVGVAIGCTLIGKRDVRRRLLQLPSE